MIAQALARGAYSVANTEFGTPQTAEYEAFARVTRGLKSATTLQSRIAALHDNRRLWILLATDVADPGNRLPDNLRAGIFYLAEFTQQHTSKVLREAGDTDVLIEINKAIMRGLCLQQEPKT